LAITKKTGVIPAQAGIPFVQCSKGIPACAGMTVLFILFCFRQNITAQTFKFAPLFYTNRNTFLKMCYGFLQEKVFFTKFLQNKSFFQK
jgi:hypothetical protein